MSLVDVDLKKLREKMNYRPIKRNMKSHETNKEKTLSILGIKTNKHKNTDLAFLKNKTYKLSIIDKYLFQKVPFLNSLEFTGSDTNNCTKRLVEKYIGSGAEISRINIKEAIKLAEGEQKTLKAIENEKKKQNEEEAAKKKKEENELKKAAIPQGGMSPSAQKRANQLNNFAKNINKKINVGMLGLRNFEKIK